MPLEVDASRFAHLRQREEDTEVRDRAWERRHVLKGARARERASEGLREMREMRETREMREMRETREMREMRE